ncbi:MAG: FHA domain-containing protein [Anaerolineaceae bacterium]
MKFGALLVIDADGQERRYEIDVPSLLVGRGPGSGILLDDPSIGERHARLLVESGVVTLEDLGTAGGTFVGGRRIEPHTQNHIGPGQQLRFGDLVARYLEPPPVDIEAVVPVTQRRLTEADERTVRPLSRVLLSLSLPDNPIRAGDMLKGSLRVENRGRVVDRLRLDVSGIPAQWLQGWRAELSLVPGAITTLPIVIKPPVAPESTAGDHAVVFTATSGVDARESVAVGQIRILPFERLTVGLEPLRSNSRFELVVTNVGNRPVNVQLEAVGQEEGVSIDLEASGIDLGPGEERRVGLRAKSNNRPAFGRENVVLFTAAATPRNSAAGRVEAFGQLELRPPLQPWKLPLQILFALAVVASVFAIFWFDWPLRADTRDFNIPAIPIINEDKAAPAASPIAAKPAPTTLAGVQKDDAAAILAKSEERYKGVHLCGVAKDSAAKPTPVPSSTSPLFRQTDPRWADDIYAAAGLAGPKSSCGKTLAQCGCAVTSMATVLALLQLVTMPDGQPLSPKAMNQWFEEEAAQDSNGWTSRGYSYGDVVWTSANALSGAVAKAKPGTQRIRFLGAGSGAIEEIRPALQANIPVILEVPGHYIAATGIQGDKVTIHDPYYPERTSLDFYAGKVLGSVLFEPADDLSAITITVSAEMRVRVTDAEGHVTGTLDGATPGEAERAAKRDIPGSSYTFKDAWRDPNCIETAPPAGAGTHQVHIPRPAAGAYKIEIINAKGGGTSGAVHIYDRDGNVRIQRDEGTGNRTFTVQAG